MGVKSSLLLKLLLCADALLIECLLTEIESLLAEALLLTKTLLTESLLTETLLPDSLLSEALLTEVESLLAEALLTKTLLSHVLLVETLLTEILLVEPLLSKVLLVEALLAEVLLTETLLTEVLLIEALLAKSLLTEILLTEVLLAKSLLTEILLAEALLSKVSLPEELLLAKSLVRVQRLLLLLSSKEGGCGKTALGANALRPSLVSLSLRHHSPLLILKGLLVEEIGSVGVIVLWANGSDVAGLRASSVAESLLSVLLGLAHVAASLPLSGLKLESLGLLIARESLIAVIGMSGSIGVREAQARVERLLSDELLLSKASS